MAWISNAFGKPVQEAYYSLGDTLVPVIDVYRVENGVPHKWVREDEEYDPDAIVMENGTVVFATEDTAEIFIVE